MRILFTIYFLLCTCFPVYAQQAVGRVVDGTIFPGTSVTRNYVKNTSALKNALNVTTSSAAIARDTDAADKIDGVASFTCDASAQNGYCLFQLDTIQEGDKTGTCEAKLLYKGDASLYALRITDTSSTLAETATLTNAADWTAASITYACGATRDIRFVQTVAGTGAAVNLGRVYYGKVTAGTTASSSTGINYITKYDAESGTTGWAKYDDGSSETPVDGTGGATITTTWTTSSSSPLREANSFLLTKSAADYRGEGVSYDFTIDPADRGKVLQGSFEYAIASGTFADDDVRVWIYYIDGASSKLIPTTPYLLKNHTLTAEKFPFEFQTEGAPSSALTYRLILHVSSTSALAYTLKFDNFIVGPQAKLYGSPITDLQEYSLTIGADTTAPTQGAGATNKAYWKKVGDKMEIRFEYSQAAAGTSGSGGYRFPLPPGYSVDSSKTKVTSLGNDQSVGSASGFDGTTTFVGLNVYVGGTNYLKVFSSTGAVGSTIIPLGNTNARLGFVASVPILGWSSSAIMSNDAATNVIGFRANNSSTSINGTPAKIVWTNTDRDDVGAYSSGTYTVKVPGWYEVEASLYTAATPTVDQVYQLFIYRNGAALKGHTHRYKVASATTTSIGPVKDKYYYNAGDTIEIYASSDATSPSISSNTTQNVVSISRLSGPSQIAASESISARYTTAAGQSLTSSGEVVDFGTKDYDNRGAVTTGAAWKFSAPISGEYSISAMVYFSELAWTEGAANAKSVAIRKNGTIHQYVSVVNVAANHTGELGLSGAGKIKLLAGDYIDIFVTTNEGSDRALYTNATLNWVAIDRIGNY